MYGSFFIKILNHEEESNKCAVKFIAKNGDNDTLRFAQQALLNEYSLHNDILCTI